MARMQGQRGVAVRSVEDSVALLDRIVGRCVRDAEFGRRVLACPETALAEYGLNADELDDFVVLQRDHAEEARAGWARLRAILAAGGAQSGSSD
jgi:hypothetical protein